MSGHRIDRLNEEVRREISAILREIKDPRLSGMISVVSADVTNDLRYAKIYVSIMGDETFRREAIEGLKSASGFVRRELGARVRMRYTPELIFVPDDSITYGAHINDLLDRIAREERTKRES